MDTDAGPGKFMGFVLIGVWSDVIGEFFGVNRDSPEASEVFSLQLFGGGGTGSIAQGVGETFDFFVV